MAKNYFVKLPAYEVGPGLDTRPISNALAEVRKSNEFQQRQDLDQQRLGMQEEQLGMQRKTHDEDMRARKVKEIAGIAQLALQQEDPQAGARIWNKTLANYPQLPGALKEHGIDPADHVNGPKFLIAQATGYRNPLEDETTRATIGMQRAHTNLYEAQAAKERAAATSAGAVFKTPKERYDVEEGVRKELTGLGKDYSHMRDAVARINTASDHLKTNPDKPGPADVAMIFNYMKMLDPQSVVREGEFETARKTGGIPDYVWGWFERVKSGAVLPPSVRNEIVAISNNLFKTQEGQFKRIQDQYRGVSERMGVDPRNTILDLGQPPRPQEPSAPAFNPPMSPRVQSPSGQGQIPPGAVRALQGNPERAAEFDAKYGPGASRQFLQGSR